MIRKQILEKYPKAEKENKKTLTEGEAKAVSEKTQKINEQKKTIEETDTQIIKERAEIATKKVIIAWKIRIKAKKEGIIKEFWHSKHIGMTEKKTKTYKINKTVHYIQS